MNEQQQPTSQKPPRGSPKQITIAGSFCLVLPRPHLKKMFTEVALILPLYLPLFFILWQFQHMKIISDVENILNDVVLNDTPKDGIEQHEKRKCLERVY